MIRTFIFLVPLFLGVFQSFAQQDFTGLAEHELSLEFQRDSSWSHGFSITNRNRVYSEEHFGMTAEFLEIAHATGRKIGRNSELEAGIRYRFENGRGKDEIRLSQQYTYSKKSRNIRFEHRFRLAQRFREATSFRTRYLFSALFPLQQQVAQSNKLNMGLSAEAVWEFGRHQTPEYDQRYSAFLDYALFERANLNLGLEYRWRDFTGNPYSQLFLLTGLEFSL